MRFRVYTSRAVNSQALSSLLGRYGSVNNRALGKRTSEKRRLLIEHLSARQVLANVAGFVFADENQSWRRESAESGVMSQVVFADANDNGLLDEGDTVVLTDEDGRFEFDGLSGDDAIIRLFNGSSTAALPFFPVAASVSELTAISDGTSFASFRDGQLVTLAGSAVVRSDIGSGASLTSTLPAAVRAAEFLPDGRLLILSSDSVGNHAFTLSEAGTLSPIALQTPGPASGWVDVALDASGNGLLVEQSDESTLLRAVSVGESIVVGNTTTTVGSGTRVVSGGDVTSVISTPTDDGLRLRLWSNATGTEIGTGGVEIAGGSEVLSYDDASGLVLLRTAADSVTLLDAASGFASLQTITGVAGPVVIDAARELLFAVSPADAVLQIIDLNSAGLLGQFAIDTEDVATARQLAFDSATGNLLLLTATGLTTVSLQRANSHRVKLGASAPQYQLSFAIDTPGQNAAPKFDSLPSLSVAEDSSLSVVSPKLLETASDADGDKFIVIVQSSTENGVLAVTPTGGMGYIPNRDFFGSDSLKVILHDGQTPSEPFELAINVTPVDDPIEITVTPNVLPENAEPDAIAALVKVVHADGGNIVWTTDDPRFNVVEEKLVVAPGSLFNYDEEPAITIELRATHPASGEVATATVNLTVGEVIESIKEIRPDSATIDENRPGELIAELSVLDDGSGEDYLFTVDDPRFQVTFRDLRLKPGISLDFESEPTVTLSVTATNAAGASKTEPLIITVRDIAEQASEVALASAQVKELVRGATVGNVLVDGNVMGTGYRATVDDSRFTVEGGQLKLRASEFVRRSAQQEIQVVVTVQDIASAFLPIVGTFVIEVLANQNPFHNEQNPYDVNGDQQVNPLDALLIINTIGRNGGPGPISSFPSPDRFYDVNGDGLITALDALLIINYLNRRARSGEGEPVKPNEGAAPNVPPATSPSTPNSAVPSATTSLPTEDKALPSSFGGSRQAEGESLGETEYLPSESRDELTKLRDDALELLVDDALSSADEVDAAINDFL